MSKRLVISALVVSFLAIVLSATLSGCTPMSCRESKEHHAELQGPVVEQWVNIYDHKDKNIASQLVVDSLGNVYVSGTSTTTKYSSAGKKLWTVSSGKYINVDEEGNFYTTACSGDDYVTAKYNSNGKLTWSTGSEVCPTALAVDSSGNVYVTGSNYTTIKYDSGGNKLWVAHYESSAISHNFPDALAVDSSGNVYLIGLSIGAYTASDYQTIKYNSYGNQLWVAHYNGPGSSYDYVKAMALDELGNVYVTGYSPGNGTGTDYATVKYDSDGNQLWVARYNGPANSDDEPCDMVIDTAGNIYVTGSSHGNHTQYTGGLDYATIKYDADGNQMWVVRYSSPDGYWDQARAIAVDSLGNAYVTGDSSGNIATLKYDTSGNQVWIARYSGELSMVYPYSSIPSYYNDQPYAIELDAQGNVYVAGSTTTKVCIGGLDERDYADYVIIKYTQ